MKRGIELGASTTYIIDRLSMERTPEQVRYEMMSLTIFYHGITYEQTLVLERSS
jgi:hypothetical protein